MAVYDTSGLTGTLATMNSTGLPEACLILKFYNASDVGITISLDGATDQDFIPAGGTFILDLQTNSDGFGSGRGHWSARKGQIFYGSGSAGTGNLYIIGYH